MLRQLLFWMPTFCWCGSSPTDRPTRGMTLLVWGWCVFSYVASLPVRTRGREGGAKISKKYLQHLPDKDKAFEFQKMQDAVSGKSKTVPIHNFKPDKLDSYPVCF